MFQPVIIFIQYLYKNSTLSNIKDIFSILASSVAIIGIFVTFINVITSRKSLQSKVSMDAINLLDGPNGEIRDLRKKFDQLTDKKEELPTVSEKDYLLLDKLAREYDKAGLLVKHKIIPIDFLFDFYSQPITKAWKFIHPFIENERKKRGQPGHMKKFEILAIGASLYRKDKYQEDCQFIISKDDKAEWKKWNIKYKKTFKD